MKVIEQKGVVQFGIIDPRLHSQLHHLAIAVFDDRIERPSENFRAVVGQPWIPLCHQVEKSPALIQRLAVAAIHLTFNFIDPIAIIVS